MSPGSTAINLMEGKVQLEKLNWLEGEALKLQKEAWVYLKEAKYGSDGDRDRRVTEELLQGELVSVKCLATS